jgi:hypothetical protein
MYIPKPNGAIALLERVHHDVGWFNICRGCQRSKFDTVTHGRPTCMIDALVVQVSQAGESSPQYVLLDRGGDCCCVDQL